MSGYGGQLVRASSSLAGTPYAALLPRCPAPRGAGLVGWQRCPVCRGKGIVQRGFYLPPGFPLVPNGLTVEVCRSCNGEGIIR